MDSLIDSIEQLSLSNSHAIEKAEIKLIPNNHKKAGIVLLRWNNKLSSLQVLLLKGKNTWDRKGMPLEYSTTRPDQIEIVKGFWKFREGKWGPPKGNIEDDEKADDAARREFEEETGRNLEFFKADVVGSIKIDGNFYLIALAQKWVTIHSLNLQKSEIHQARWVNLRDWKANAHVKERKKHNRVSRLLSEHDYSPYATNKPH